LTPKAQAAEPRLLRIVIIRKGKRMVTIKPAVVGMAAFGGRSECDDNALFGVFPPGGS
jgi:hypothetical protein